MSKNRSFFLWIISLAISRLICACLCCSYSLCEVEDAWFCESRVNMRKRESCEDVIKLLAEGSSSSSGSISFLKNP